MAGTQFGVDSVTSANPKVFVGLGNVSELAELAVEVVQADWYIAKYFH